MAIKQVPQEINKQMILNLYSFFFLEDGKDTNKKLNTAREGIQLKKCPPR